ncbi:hypothetical protein [Paenibacillus koleovorans]|uniref:hypothetical protein n=1 Tax=Paenibacillus koleovorans TaxID=121608 RepID=UPI000FDADD16|nr:hypothetical protein [Paenibacillus koleovorans]
MKVNTNQLVNLASSEGWSIPQLAVNLGVDYSYLHRVLKGKKNGGGKLFNGIYRLCKDKGLDVEGYIFLDKSLFVNNESGLRRNQLGVTQQQLAKGIQAQ